MDTISTEELRRRVDEEDATPVFVLSEFLFAQEHIPGAINIPEEDVEREFPQRFDEDEQVIIYCASESCQAAPRVGQKLEAMGYENVTEYEPGLEGWKERGLPLTGAEAPEAD